MSRRGAALRELLATIGMETPQKAVAKIVPALITAILVAWFYPAENPCGKTAAGAVALLIVMAVLYGWSYLTFKAPHLTVGLSPLYTPEGRRQFRSEQRAKADEIARLSSQSARLAAEMAKLDITTDDGQRKFKQLADEKRPIDQNLAALETLPKLRLGYMPGD